MRGRTEDPRVFDKDGVTLLKMGDWVRKIPPEYLDLERKIAAMDKNGIDVTLLTSNDPGPEWFGADGPTVAQLLNDGVSDIVRTYRGRFAGLCVLPLQDQAAAERELDRCVKTLRMKGILLYSNLAGEWPDEPRFRWLFARAEELGVPIVLHPALPTTLPQTKGHELTGLLGNMFENTISLARLVAAGLFDEFPKLKFVCPHLGGTLPYIAGRFDHQVLVLKRSNQNLERKPSDYLRSIYLDIVSPLPEAIRFAVDFTGVDRLLYASDHPWVQPEVIMSSLDKVRLRPKDRAKILGRNAAALFDLPG
ncbi:amidohydrolase family protein [Microlunatus speluncae]|uniref:amidohydrolase family protein n=1 Tax=Microlunatus speluncae TaxID=2594267 RepID=UPI001FE2D30B|nr:amidohydrolase family protein [Microlunatus speluncae]